MKKLINLVAFVFFCYVYFGMCMLAWETVFGN